MLVEALPRSSALLRSAAALLAHHTLGALFKTKAHSGANRALFRLFEGSFKALFKPLSRPNAPHSRRTRGASAASLGI